MTWRPWRQACLRLHSRHGQLQLRVRGTALRDDFRDGVGAARCRRVTRLVRSRVAAAQHIRQQVLRQRHSAIGLAQRRVAVRQPQQAQQEGGVATARARSLRAPRESIVAQNHPGEAVAQTIMLQSTLMHTLNASDCIAAKAGKK